MRWIGRRTVPATGNFAPIRIAAGAFGDHGTLLVSPQHRVLLRDAMAELLFGEDEVLVAAKDLLNHDGVCRVEGGQVEYVHLLFDRHQVIWAEGLPTESFLPGPQMSHSFDGAVLQELVTLFPELDPMTGHGYGPAARRMLRGYEAQLLLTGAA
ncbi:Hint domain-containing protein [Gemmobacter lanyuensis]